MEAKVEKIKVETYTYLEETNGKTMEVALVGIDAENIGIDNTFEPPGFYRKHITTWLRKRYFFLDGRVYAQIPRDFQNYPDVVLNQFEYENSYLTDVVRDNGVIKMYYPISDSEAVCLEWNTKVDNWSMSVVNQPSEGNIINDCGDAEGCESVWKSL